MSIQTRSKLFTMNGVNGGDGVASEESVQAKATKIPARRTSKPTTSNDVATTNDANDVNNDGETKRRRRKSVVRSFFFFKIHLLCIL